MKDWQLIVLIVACAAAGTALVALLYRPVFKRAFDILFSGLALILLSPIYAVLAVLIRKKLGKPVIFCQRRPGKKGKIFRMHKFRTMTDARGENGELLPDEARMTRFGGKLRALSLDELPEIWDIFRGKMSIIGPRPLREEYLPLYNEEQAHRHDVRPGLTGLAQVSGRNALSWEKKFELDVRYVRRFTIFTDIKIFFLTIAKVFKREGISQEGAATMEAFTGTKTVLLLSAGRRVELVKCFKKHMRVLAADISPTAPALYFADKRFLIPRIGEDGYPESIRKIISEERVDLVVPTIDTELTVLYRNKAFLEAAGCKVMVDACAETCCDKALFAVFAEQNGLPVPRTYTYTEALAEGAYPYFIKPSFGSSSIGVFKVKNERELRFFNEYVQNPIIQEALAGAEYTVDALFDFAGELIAAVPRIRLSTRGGEILKGRVHKNGEVIDAVRQLASVMRPQGMITVQGILTEEGFKIIEVNPRFGGGAPIGILAGADFCRMLKDILCGEKLEYTEDYDEITVARFDDSIRVNGHA